MGGIASEFLIIVLEKNKVRELVLFLDEQIYNLWSISTSVWPVPDLVENRWIGEIEWQIEVESFFLIAFKDETVGEKSLEELATLNRRVVISFFQLDKTVFGHGS